MRHRPQAHTLPARLIGLIGLISLIGPTATAAQDSARLALRLDAALFFQDNEYFSRHGVGYTLPGFSLTPRIAWRVEPRVSLEAGLHWLHFWGAQAYPAGCIGSVWPTLGDSTARRHLLPWVRADVRMGDHLCLTLGCLHRDEGHHLPLPLYNPERLYATDPEAGVQLRVGFRHLEADLWVDWTDYIWQRSLRQEHFTAGLTLRASLPLGDHTELYLPLALVGQHTGGQGLEQARPVQNHFNAAAALGLGHQCGPWTLRAECLAAAFSQKNSTSVPFRQGWGLYPTLHVGYRQAASLDLGYWQGHGFAPLLGSQLFSNLGVVGHEATLFDQNRMLTVGARYVWRTFASTTLTVEGRYYHYLVRENAPQYSVGILLDLQPTLVLLK